MELDSSAQNQNFELQIIHPIHDMDDSKLIGAPVVNAEDIALMVSGKRKRGRPPRGQSKPQPVKTKQEDEDVCFICFDGGSLVLCDRRGCPKAYHPSCVKRDEAFFRSKARWNCGWHICSVCQKSAHYMCYTCTYSLCKACTKDADYVCVRGDKGFCTTCMRTVMLIENNEQGNKETVQVDFDDKSSWEYLFKVYWIYLKGKLSLTLTELAQAKNPWKTAATTMGCKGLTPAVHYGTNNGKRSITNSFSHCLETNSCKKIKTGEQLKIPNKDLVTEKQDSDDDKSLIGHTEWATKELLEFVAHMKNGDTSVLSQFDVQALLLEYIKINNLRDPHRKSQIICDSRLKNMFYKPRVGHFEMLKLLEYHFFIKEEPRKDVFIRGGVVDAVASQVEADGNNDNLMLKSKDKKRKTRRKGEERVQQTNLEEYAAIDVHNINLIYLRRNLMESLIDDSEKFHEKVVGSIVRIRISSGDQKQDMYRLVQVVGTIKVAVPYKIGNRTSDVMLKVLNLDKKEDISIDAISNQDFSEEECRRLRQSIRCGLVKQLTVGEILQKAMALQTVKLNDWLETEILRLTHLRDRASEKGRKKELRECVEKLQLLKTPAERQSRLREIPEVHSDPNMDPNYQSDEDAGESNEKKQDEYPKLRYSAYGGKGSKPISPRGRGGTPNGSTNKAWKISTTFEYTDKQVGPTKSERVNECKDEHNLKVKNEEGSTAILSKPNIPLANDCETDKLWHYRDPNGKIQGPFSMVQLQKWSTTGYFPPDMRIWGSRQEDSVLLTDALNGQLLYNISLQSQEVGGASVNEKDHNIERLNSDSNHGNQDSHETRVFQTTGGHDNENQSNTQGSSGQSSGQNWKPLLNGEADIPDLHSPTPTTTSCGGSEGQATGNKQSVSSIIPVQDSDITDLPSPTPKSSTEDQKELVADNKPSVPSNFPAQDSNPSWSSASSLILGGAQLPDLADEWGGYSPTPPKPCAEEWDSGPTSVSSPKPHDSTSDDRVATPTSTSNQLTHSYELIEFSTLAEESVSDLLAEVDAMESQGGLASPTSVMNCGGDDFIYGPKDDCFSSIEEFSSTPEPGKSDALSSTQSTITDEPVGSSLTDFFERSNGFTNLGWGDAIVSHHGALGRNVGWESQQNYDWGGQRCTGLKDQDFNQDGNSGFTRGNKSLSSKQPFGGGVEGGYSRPPPKGRVCKFYESGHCKKGAFCSYLHQ